MYCCSGGWADCTGHAMAGAFMSMLGTAFLNEIAICGSKQPSLPYKEINPSESRDNAL